MARRLSAQEWALWSRVAASVRPLPGRASEPASDRVVPSPALAAPAAAAKPVMPLRPAKPARPALPAAPRPALATPKPALPIASATLDGGWDRRLRGGDIRPDRAIDLHGHTLGAAHDRLMAELDTAHAIGARVLLVVTGKGRGERPGRIRAQLADWLEGSSLRSRIAALRPAHVRHGGSGAFYVILRR
jgi:DNA-nicking Smr family endonuclease